MNIRFLHKQGHSARELARLTGHSRNTVRKLLQAKRPPSPVNRVRPSKLDAYKPYLTERWQAHSPRCACSPRSWPRASPVR